MVEVVRAQHLLQFRNHFKREVFLVWIANGCYRSTNIGISRLLDLQALEANHAEVKCASKKSNHLATARLLTKGVFNNRPGITREGFRISFKPDLPEETPGPLAASYKSRPPLDRLLAGPRKHVFVFTDLP